MSAEAGEKLRRALTHPVAGNALALYLTQFGSLLIPLLSLPYLARVLRPEGWGLVVFAQSFAVWLSLVIEYGFRLSMTRELARRRDEPGAVPALVAGALGAQALLVAGAAAAAVVAWQAVPRFQADGIYAALALALAVALGLSPAWYFQGIERMRVYAGATLAGQVLYLIGVFTLVRGPADGWRVLAVQAVGVGAATVFCLSWMARGVAITAPRLAGALAALRGGFGLFLFLNLVNLYTTANGFILGLVAPPALAMQAVSYFGGAERLVRGALSVFAPLAQALYPRLSHLMARDPAAAARVSRWVLVVMVALGLTVGAGLFLAAPLLIRVLLGPGYEPAVTVLRILALLAPVIAVSTTLGTLWMLPLGMDRAMAAIVLGAGALNVVLALSLAARAGHVGMAWAVVTAEVVVSAGMAVLLRRRRLDPFRARPAGETR